MIPADDAYLTFIILEAAANRPIHISHLCLRFVQGKVPLRMKGQRTNIHYAKEARWFCEGIAYSSQVLAAAGQRVRAPALRTYPRGTEQLTDRSQHFDVDHPISGLLRMTAAQ